MNAPTDTARRPLHTVAAALGALVLAGSLGHGDAHALAGDVVVVDPFDGHQQLSYNWASNPSGEPVLLNPTFSTTTRSAYTQAAPLDLPCDLNWLAAGVTFRSVHDAPLYGEIGGMMRVNGVESAVIPNYYGQNEGFAPLMPPVAPGASSGGGFIFVAQLPLVSWAAEQIPANVPIKIRMFMRGFSANTYDVPRGGFSAANQIPEATVWNNTWFLWIRRSCPGA
ncbi:MAG: hypothetical protein U0324_12695 [Polyangiales bacterium]